ncbi:MAG: hypothetical protein GVY29_02030 [Spirochaetes bacterium]|jgi:hypothetical protein|nr:hypothetical protein [Spirochaetota bacterium]
MKQSTRVLLISVGGILIVIVAMVITARAMFGNIVSGRGAGGNRVELSGTRDSQEFTIEGFDRVVTEGTWQVEITQGSEYRVRITADEEVLERLIVERRSDSLFLDMPGNLPIGGLDVEAEVTMPSLDRVETKGGADVSLRDFDLDTLRVQSEGAANVEAEESRIETLYVESEGATNIDFKDSVVVNADVRVAGAGNVILTMAGGRLTGSLEGVGSLSYGGTVSEESVDVRGLGSVERQ